MMRHPFFVFVMLCIVTNVSVAAAIFTISPSLTATTLRSDSSTIIPYTVTNSTNSVLSGITINPNFSTGAHLSMNNNTCSTLAPRASCSFNLVMAGQNQPVNFVVSPEVCAFNRTACSQPIVSNRINVAVDLINHPTRAFVGLNFSVYPITLVPNNVGVFGAVIYGFSLNEPAGIAVNTAGTLAYVTNTGTNQIYVINTSSNHIFQVFNVGTVPAAVAVSPNGLLLYVANYNDGQSNGTLSVLNAISGALLATIPVGNGPWGVAVSPDGNKVYVTNSADSSVTVINAITNTVMTSINVGTTPLGIAATPDGTKVYVVNTGSNTVSVINTSNNQVIATVNVGNLPKGIAVNPTSTQAYVANWQDGTVDIINTATNQITIPPINVSGGPLGLAVSPDGTQLYATLDQANAVAVINLTTYGVGYVFTPAPELTMGNFIG